MIYINLHLHLQSELKQKEAKHMVRDLLEDIVGGMRTPERPSSPVDAYITDEEIFRRNNPKVFQDLCVQIIYEFYFIIPPTTKWRGGILESPWLSFCLSVCPWTQFCLQLFSYSFACTALKCIHNVCVHMKLCKFNFPDHTFIGFGINSR